jgi:hypothetical protein
MRKKKQEKALTVLEELRALEHTPPKRANRLLARHLQCEKSLQLSDVVAGAAQKSSQNSAAMLETPAGLLSPLA